MKLPDFQDDEIMWESISSASKLYYENCITKPDTGCPKIAPLQSNENCSPDPYAKKVFKLPGLFLVIKVVFHPLGTKDFTL